MRIDHTDHLSEVCTAVLNCVLIEALVLALWLCWVAYLRCPSYLLVPLTAPARKLGYDFRAKIVYTAHIVRRVLMTVIDPSTVDDKVRGAKNAGTSYVPILDPSCWVTVLL